MNAAAGATRYVLEGLEPPELRQHASNRSGAIAPDKVVVQPALEIDKVGGEELIKGRREREEGRKVHISGVDKGKVRNGI